MQIEIQKPEVAQRAQSYIESGRFHDGKISLNCATRCAVSPTTSISAGTPREPVRSIYERFSFGYQHPIGIR
jgi:hypothetical protein